MVTRVVLVGLILGLAEFSPAELWILVLHSKGCSGHDNNCGRGGKSGLSFGVVVVMVIEEKYKIIQEFVRIKYLVVHMSLVD